ncbi:RNA polymerase factor sigma-54 [Paenibacillaceae bacterium WGS1546]|uniref:RNA polymerase factor sigma-54 n=1 Tax=Cohnella sp. WGS1546 TaxID=3366810 RepID=UPI00372D7EF4
MQFEIQLSSQQQLKLNLTPAMRQSIDILQLHSADLVSYLQEIANENPIIEIQYRPVRDEFGPLSRGSALGQSELPDPIAAIRSREETLEESLIRQLHLSDRTGEIVSAAVFLAGNLNDDGYLEIDLMQASALANRPVGLMMEALILLQSMDPPGIAARSLAECLELQIERDDHAPAYAKSIVQSHFRELAGGKIGHIAKKLKIRPEQAEKAAAYVRSLNPRPGLAVSPSSLAKVVPDAEIAVFGNRVQITVFDHHLPAIRINKSYELLIGRAPDSDASLYLKDKLQQAKSVMHGLKQRKQTLLRVVEAIYERQRDYFKHGEKGLRPLSMKELSAQLELHESTISRTVQNKFLQTSQGIVSLKSFFSHGLSDQEGQSSASQTAIKQRIREMIEGEIKRKPYSDSQLADLLRKDGLQISRRTVTKYREELRILSSVLRRQTAEDSYPR